MANKLEESPEFQKALNEACEKQYRGWLYGGEYAKAHSKDKIAGTMEEMHRRRKAMETEMDNLRLRAEEKMRQAEIMMNPHMKEITDTLKKRYSSSGLICPICGEGDHGNKMGGKPYCFMNAKHNGLGPIPLMTPEEAKEWKPPPKKSKPQSFTFKEIDGVVRK